LVRVIPAEPSRAASSSAPVLRPHHSSSRSQSKTEGKVEGAIPLAEKWYQMFDKKWIF
jgi:hypothetical protein